MFEHDTTKENAYRLSRFDEQHLLSSVSPHPIELEESTWPTAEHYLWVSLVKNPKYHEAIKAAASGHAAYKLASPWYRSKIDAWKSKRKVLMTRALYIKVQMYPEVKETLMATGDNLILETSLYDHYWGIGRDQRGENIFGEIWMDIRKRLQASE